MGKTTDVKQEILGIAQALRDTLKKGRAEYEALVRKTRWGEGPIFLVGSGASWPSALVGAYALESLLGWPVVARPAAVFGTYTLPALRPRSVLLVVPSDDDMDEILEVARAARSRGAVVLILSHQPTSPLATMADGVFLLRTGEQGGLGLKARVCQPAALSAIALAAARIFKRHNEHADVVYEEFENLSESIEWVLVHLSDGVGICAAELAGLRRLWVVGGGFYHPAALQAALVLREITDLDADGFEASEFARRRLESLGPEVAVLFLSGTRCRLKKEIHQAAKRVRERGGKTFSVTDRNDSELAAGSAFAVLLPVLSEMAGSVLTLGLVEWLAYQAVERRRGLDRSVAVEKVGSKKAQGSG